MKKTGSILLLIMLLFNWFGYRMVSAYLQDEASLRMDARVSSQSYDPADLIELRIPLHIPYAGGWTDFENCRGETVYHGIHYRYIKRKFENDSLVLICLPDSDQGRIEYARDQFFRLVNDLQQNESGRKPANSGSGLSFKIFMSNYYEQPDHWSLSALDGALPSRMPFHHDRFVFWYNETPLQPPRLA